jgi:hypothetical protein
MPESKVSFHEKFVLFVIAAILVTLFLKIVFF